MYKRHEKKRCITTILRIMCFSFALWLCVLQCIFGEFRPDLAWASQSPSELSAPAKNIQNPAGFTELYEESRPYYPDPSKIYADSIYYKRLMDVELTGNQRVDIVRVALSQVGYHEGDSMPELDGSGNGTTNFAEYCYWYGRTIWGRPEGMFAEWCAIYVTWCARAARISENVISNSDYAIANGSGTTFKNLTLYNPAEYTPREGDLVFFNWNVEAERWSHIGIAVCVEGDYVMVVEGNAFDAVRIRVTEKDDKLIKYYAVPDYPSSDVPLSSEDVYQIAQEDILIPRQVPRGFQYICKAVDENGIPMYSNQYLDGYYVDTLKYGETFRLGAYVNVWERGVWARIETAGGALRGWINVDNQGFVYAEEEGDASSPASELMPEPSSTQEEATPEEMTPEEVTPEEVTPEEATPEEATPEEATPEEMTREAVTAEAAEDSQTLRSEGSQQNPASEGENDGRSEQAGDHGHGAVSDTSRAFSHGNADNTGDASYVLSGEAGERNDFAIEKTKTVLVISTCINSVVLIFLVRIKRRL